MYTSIKKKINCNEHIIIIIYNVQYYTILLAAA